MAADESLNPSQFTAGFNYQRDRLQEDLSGIETFGARRWHESQVVARHRQKQVVTKGFGYQDRMDTSRQLKVIGKAMSEGVVEDWQGEVDDAGQPVALSDFTTGRRSLRDFEMLPETYDDALNALISKRRSS